MARSLMSSPSRLTRKYRVTDGRRFRLRDIDPGDTGDLSDEDKPRAREALRERRNEGNRAADHASGRNETRFGRDDMH